MFTKNSTGEFLPNKNKTESEKRALVLIGLWEKEKLIVITNTTLYVYKIVLERPPDKV